MHQQLKTERTLVKKKPFSGTAKHSCEHSDWLRRAQKNQKLTHRNCYLKGCCENPIGYYMLRIQKNTWPRKTINCQFSSLQRYLCTSVFITKIMSKDYISRRGVLSIKLTHGKLQRSSCSLDVFFFSNDDTCFQRNSLHRSIFDGTKDVTQISVNSFICFPSHHIAKFTGTFTFAE